MPKPITLEMLEAMDLDQRRTLFKNASAMDTPASRAVLDLLSQGDLITKPKVAAKTPRRVAAKPRSKAAAKPVKAVFGRQG